LLLLLLLLIITKSHLHLQCVDEHVLGVAQGQPFVITIIIIIITKSYLHLTCSVWMSMSWRRLGAAIYYY